MKTITPLLLLLAQSVVAQSFTITPSSTLRVNAPAGWSGATTVYNPSDRSFSAPGGLYIPDIYSVKGGLYVEMDILITKANAIKSGVFLTKSGTTAFGLNCGKVKLDYISGSMDQVNGSDTIPVNTWTKVCFGIDTVGRIVGTLNGIEDINRPSYFRGALSQTTNTQFTFLKDLPGRCRSIKVWAGTKPPISKTGFEAYASYDKEQIKFRFTRIDRSQVNQPFSIIQESPNGAQATMHKGLLREGALVFKWADYMNGSWTFHLATSKCVVSKTVMKGNGPIMPTFFTVGAYSVNATDFKLMKGLGFNTVYSDFPINNNPPNYKQMPSYLDTAKKYGLQSAVRMGLQASKGNLEFTNSPFLWYAQDEAPGFFEGMDRNFWACNAMLPNVPVLLNLNNFARIDEAAEMCHILGLNIYSSGRNVYDITRKASELRTTFVTLPQYETPDGKIFYTQEQMINLTAQAVVAGASGVFWFTWDDQKKSSPGRYYTAKFPDRVENLRQCNLVLNGLSLDWRPVSTGNPDVAACYRGEELWVVNLSSEDQVASVEGRTVRLSSLGVEIQ